MNNPNISTGKYGSCTYIAATINHKKFFNLGFKEIGFLPTAIILLGYYLQSIPLIIKWTSNDKIFNLVYQMYKGEIK